jgi:hypothetical protein
MKLVFSCCFCGQDIPDDEGKGVALVNRETGGFEQQWWSHLSCFLGRLTPTARDAYSTSFEEDD